MGILGQPTVSVVINTNGRRDALANTLRSLKFLDYPNFEVCVVCGPTEDGTKELVRSMAGQVKVASCPEYNLSMSRNIGIGLAAGQIVAFVDDDGIPEAEWLRDLVAGYDDPRVAASGGVVYNHTGWEYQYLYTTANRLGNADWRRTTPADEYNFPLSNNFPYLQGTNTSFRRDYLLDVGGFDEEIEFYLDETDVCCRMVDRGFVIRQLPNALVHHKFLPSHIRNTHKVTRNRFPVIKNKIYFSIVNNHGHYTMTEVIDDAKSFIDGHAQDARMHLEAGRLSQNDYDQFWKDVDRAWARGLGRGLSGERQLLTRERAARLQEPYLEFPRQIPPGGRKVFCFFSQEFPPGRIGGIGTYTRAVTAALADAGHHVHVLTRSEQHNTVDFEDNVWVHRLEIKNVPPPEKAAGLTLPRHIWNYSATMLEEVHKIDAKRHVSCIEGPIWDGEPIAPLLDGCFPVALSLHTSLGVWLESHQSQASDQTYMAEFARPMLGIEKHLMLSADAVHANSHAIVPTLERLYNITMEPPRLQVIHHGLADPTQLPREHLAATPDRVRLLFIGRLEERKGIDVLAKALAELTPRFPEIYLDVVGNDRIPWHGNQTFRETFATWPISELLADHVTFHGQVSDELLRGFLAAADILVVPSRFESFGLTAVEGFAFGLAVVASRCGGLVEVVTDEVTGLLVDPDDVGGLAGAIERLVVDLALRSELAGLGRDDYERRFSSTRMAGELAEFFGRIERRYLTHDDITRTGGELKPVSLWATETGLLMDSTSEISFEVPTGQAFVTFWTHPWSGIVEITQGGHILRELDLFARVPRLRSLPLKGLRTDLPLAVRPANRRSDESEGDEVIFYRASIAAIDTSGNFGKATSPVRVTA